MMNRPVLQRGGLGARTPLDRVAGVQTLEKNVEGQPPILGHKTKKSACSTRAIGVNHRADHRQPL